MPRGCEEADERCPALALCLGTAAWWFVGLCCFPLIISQPALGCGSSASWGVPTANPLTVSFGLTVLQTGPSADDALSNPEGHLSKAKGWCFNTLVELSFFITGLFHSASSLCGIPSSPRSCCLHALLTACPADV